MIVREICTWLLIPIFFAGAGCSADKPEVHWGFGELSIDGNYGLCSKTTWDGKHSQFSSYVFDVTRFGERGHGIIDTVDSGREPPVFCSDSEVAYSVREPGRTSLVIHRFLPPKSVTVVHQHVGDTSTVWLEEIAAGSEFAFVMHDTVIAYEATGGIEIRRLHSVTQSKCLGWMPDGRWPSFSHDGSAAYCIRVTYDSLGNGYTWPYSFNVDSGYFEHLCDTSRAVDYAPQGVTSDADAYYLVRQPSKKTRNVWVCDRAGQSRPVTFFKYPQSVSFFSLTDLGLACWIKDSESRLPKKEQLQIIPLQDSR